MTDSIQTPSPVSAFFGWKNAWLLFFIYMINTGLFYFGFSVIFPVMLESTGWNRGDASIAISVSMLAYGVLFPLAVVILNKIGSRKAIITGMAGVVIGLLVLTTGTTKLWHWIVLWGIILPMALCLCGLTPIQLNIMFWFNRKRAMALGLVMTGAPLGGVIAAPVYTWFMEVTSGWRTGWGLSTVMVFLGLILSFWVRSKPEDIGQFPDGIDPNNAESDEENVQTDRVRTYKTQETWTIRSVFKTPTIYFITTASFANLMVDLLIFNHGVLHLIDLGYSNINAAMILSLILLGSGSVRLPMGWLGDRIEPRWLISSALLLMLIGFIGIWKAPSLGLLMISGPMFGICFGTLYVMIPAITGNYYGPEVFANIHGVLALPVTFISAIVPAAAGYAVDMFGSYDKIFLAITFILVCGLICSGFLSPPKQRT